MSTAGWCSPTRPGRSGAIIPPGAIVDAAGALSTGVSYRLSQGALEVTLDSAWLADPARRYPIQVDPTVSLPVGSGAADSSMYVRRGGSASGSSELQVGRRAGANTAAYVEFDLLVRDATQPTIVAVHGNGASVDTGAWRLLFAREAAGSTTAIVSIYDGSSWIRLARVPGLLNPNAWQHITINASPDPVVLTVGGDRYKSYVQAADPTQITSLEIASAGSAAVGSSAYVDNLLIEAMAATDVRLHGIVPTISPGRLVRGQPRVDVPVAVFTAPGGPSACQFRAEVLSDTP